jgi:hypothetical protein
MGEVTTIPRGACPVCHCRHRLRKDGTLQQHYRRDRRYGAYIYTYCLGSGQMPVKEV